MAGRAANHPVRERVLALVAVEVVLNGVEAAEDVLAEEADDEDDDGGDEGDDHTVQLEGTAAVMLSPRLAVGGEVRTKPDRLGFAEEDDAYDVFAAWAPARNLTLTAAYADLGDIATVKNQRGALLQLQGAF